MRPDHAHFEGKDGIALDIKIERDHDLYGIRMRLPERVIALNLSAWDVKNRGLEEAIIAFGHQALREMSAGIDSLIKDVLKAVGHPREDKRARYDAVYDRYDYDDFNRRFNKRKREKKMPPYTSYQNYASDFYTTTTAAHTYHHPHLYDRPAPTPQKEKEQPETPQSWLDGEIDKMVRAGRSAMGV